MDEAQDIYQIIFEQVLSGSNEVITKFGDGFRTLITKVKDYAVANQADAEKDILGEKGRALLEQVVAKL